MLVSVSFGSVVLFTSTGIHTNWLYFVFTLSGFDQSTVIPSGISYITNPPSILCSDFIPDTVNPFGIHAVFPSLIYFVFSVTLVPGRFFCFSASSCCLCCSSTLSSSPISSSTLVCSCATLSFVPDTAFSALPNKFPFIAKFILTPTNINKRIIVIIKAINVIPLFSFI